MIVQTKRKGKSLAIFLLTKLATFKSSSMPKAIIFHANNNNRQKVKRKKMFPIKNGSMKKMIKKYRQILARAL